MSELGSAVSAAVATDLTQLSNDELRELLVAYPALRTSLQAVWTKAVREAERRRLHQDDGHRSIGAWLRAHTLCSGRDGSSAGWFARRLSRLPLTLAAFEAAEISGSHAKQICFLMKDVPSATVLEAEADLVEAARKLDPAEFRRLVDRLRAQWVPEQTAKDAEDASKRRRLDFGDEFGGLVPITGWLEKLTAEKFQTTLNAVSTPDPAGLPADQRRTPTQRRHDALDELLSRMLDMGELPEVRREKPHVSVTVDLEDLIDGTGTADLEWTGPVDISVAQMLLCDAKVHPIVTHGGTWNPVSIVEDSDTASRKLWRYLRMRDGGCRFPGCDTPAVWCDAHHIVWRSDDGETSNDNCVLLCRYHHRLLHRPAEPWTISGAAETTLVFTSPDGQRRLESAAPGPPRCL